ncbi:uncharacterized protein DNG_06156 [Cephalotrichum gorgonifer]|uniref:Peptidase S8/S53 domain-containing protein n=1 Tax=Cephalotrichum gorgonifer TaxID=2041049 RepID=A0AAE8N1Q9_9PEZI|nr:uncharacterized protein DNG_06156 [Cephalotrichum gorgonifer]
MNGENTNSADTNAGDVVERMWLDRFPKDRLRKWLDKLDGNKLQSLYDNWEDDGEFKAYDTIVRAVKQMRNTGGSEYEPQALVGNLAQCNYNRDSPMIQELAVILSFPEDVGLSKAEMLKKTIDVWDADLRLVKKRLNHEEKTGGKTQEIIQQRADDKWQGGYDADDRWKGGDDKVAVHAICIAGPTLAFEILTDIGKSPLERASESGATGIVRIMLEELKNHLQSNPDPQGALKDRITMKSKESRGPGAFLIAAKNLRLGVLGLLLKHCPSLAGKEGLKAAITGAFPGDTDKSEEGREAALEAFKLIRNHMTDRDDMREIFAQAVRARSINVVRYLITEQDAAEAAYSNASLIIEEGTVEMWEYIPKSTREGFLKQEAGGLHKAVLCRRADIVESILKDFPREADRKAVIRPKAGGQSLNAVESRVANTICLHLSTINTEEQTFAEYVEGLVAADNSSVATRFRFERILKYAKYPDLGSQPPGSMSTTQAELQIDHREIRTVSEWLKKRLVQEVLELSVPDQLHAPHSDEDVAYCVNEFSVRVLKWRKLDLYLPALKTVPKPGMDIDDQGDARPSDKAINTQLEELDLYTSGNQSVLDQWYRELENFHSDVLSKARAQQVKKEVQVRLDEINKRLGLRWTRMNSEDGEHVPVMDYTWIKERRKTTFRKLHEITHDVVGPNLASFIKKYRGHMVKEPKLRRTKVALIDIGVVLVGARDKGQGKQEVQQQSRSLQSLNRGKDDLSERVVDGTSFVSSGDDEEPVWWHASEAHGTQMARLICSIDPCCELYVAKVAESRGQGIPSNTVADAINWAISKEVDIISLSLITYTITETLQDAIIKAANSDIVIISSTADEGVSDPRAATDQEEHKKDVIRIAACDHWGKPLRFSQDQRDYSFVGHNVHVGQVPFLKSDEVVSGSLVATAVAAGAASLALACCRLSRHCKTDVQAWRDRKARAAFDRMLEGSEQRYCKPEKICGGNKSLATADFMTTVHDSFRDFAGGPSA